MNRQIPRVPINYKPDIPDEETWSGLARANAEPDRPGMLPADAEPIGGCDPVTGDITILELRAPGIKMVRPQPVTRGVQSTILTPRDARRIFEMTGTPFVETVHGEIVPARNRAERRKGGYRKPVFRNR